MLFNTPGEVFFRKLGCQGVLWKNHERGGTSFARGKVSLDLPIYFDLRYNCIGV